MKLIAMTLVLLSNMASAGEFKSSDGARLLCPDATTQLVNEALKWTDAARGIGGTRGIKSIDYGQLSRFYRVDLSDGNRLDIPIATGCIYVYPE